ncbi:hypothetical protein G6F46_001779 [Rhizopus delemar]|uniref:Uncharacterized protein n=2 Tax=Rhizopus TaxID=4842 RepID=A0A9P6ZCL0_9FUNG|nr:hypothetical protein G6F55_006258 [Rhizopus delemar]KAG1551815.1 hypothetical protein G6F51_001609 [Rhizopus arrhizus]KAG1504098.1 hypothetical protein G6F54_001231 [Rhizopus delemar]KAG1516556.1 hypothetical protein G6F52_009422 [Rhizopus delemar]KAG1517358.1 hypothetical protein G6F53_001435 [Rhizopus delemar]
MALDEHYICQRAANAIISEIGPFRVSTDALQTINQFLDEFIVLLLRCSLSLDLSEIKATIFNLLPSTLGKNAIVEAELEVKTFTETESVDYEVYERMRKMAKDTFPVDEAISLLREKCFEYCTLADKEDQLYLQKSIQKRTNNKNIIISPIIAIYVTTIMEHIAEYLLTAVAMSAEHEETDYVRVKEVYLALIDDVQLGNVFSKMNLKERTEKRAGLSTKTARASYLPTSIPPTSNNNNNKQRNTIHEIEKPIDLEDLDLNYFADKRSSSPLSPPVRPHSVISHYSNTSRKSTFHVFKNNRNSFSQFDSPSHSPSTSIYDPDNVPSMNFDELVKSGGTVKVSLTPNRLRSIEIKDQTKDDAPSPELTWERRSMSSPRASTQLSRRASSRSTPETPKLPPKSPASPLGKKSFTINDLNRFENPREAPKPPTTIEVAPPHKKPLTPLSAMPSKPVGAMTTSTTETSMSSTSTDSTNSTASLPDPPPVISSDASKSTGTITVQESIVAPTTIRRSSVSSRKSRENLRKMRSTEHPNTPDAFDINSNKQIQFTEVQKRPPKPSIERPSSMVAKRASMVGDSRRRSVYENYATERHGQERKGSVSVSIKQWDDISRSEPTLSMPPRRSMFRQIEEMQESPGAVLDKVLKFERASSLDDVARVSSLPRRERFLYLQQDPSAIERKSTIRTTTRPLRGIDQATQTEPKEDEKKGLVDGDEEWFLQDDEWDDEQEETEVVEWLLGE